MVYNLSLQLMYFCKSSRFDYSNLDFESESEPIKIVLKIKFTNVKRNFKMQSQTMLSKCK